MVFYEWWKTVFAAVLETANLIALIILIVPSVLTSDVVLFGIGMVMEGVYLLSASVSNRYRERLRSRARSVGVLDRVLLVVSVAGFVIILFFGFGKHLLSHPQPYLTHAEGWEAGAIIWTGFFLFYYFAKFELTGNPAWDKVIIILFSLVGWKLLDLAWHSMRDPILHVLWILLIGSCFLTIDLLIWKKHRDPKEKMLSRTSFFWVDVPMVAAFLVLLVYLCYHRDIEHPDVFVSGVVSCQLLISNAVFVVMEFGLLKSPKAANIGGKQGASA